MPGSLAAPHDAQTWLSGVAQPPQKRDPAAFWVPQLGQSILLGDPTPAGFGSSFEEVRQRCVDYLPGRAPDCTDVAVMVGATSSARPARRCPAKASHSRPRR